LFFVFQITIQYTHIVRQYCTAYYAAARVTRSYKTKIERRLLIKWKIYVKTNVCVEYVCVVVYAIFHCLINYRARRTFADDSKTRQFRRRCFLVFIFIFYFSNYTKPIMETSPRQRCFHAPLKTVTLYLFAFFLFFFASRTRLFSSLSD